MLTKRQWALITAALEAYRGTAGPFSSDEVDQVLAAVGDLSSPVVQTARRDVKSRRAVKGSNPASPVSEERPTRDLRIRAVLLERRNEPIRMTDLARAVGLTPSALHCYLARQDPPVAVRVRDNRSRQARYVLPDLPLPGVELDAPDSTPAEILSSQFRRDKDLAQ